MFLIAFNKIIYNFRLFSFIMNFIKYKECTNVIIDTQRSLVESVEGGVVFDEELFKNQILIIIKMKGIRNWIELNYWMNIYLEIKIFVLVIIK